MAAKKKPKVIAYNKYANKQERNAVKAERKRRRK